MRLSFGILLAPLALALACSDAEFDDDDGGTPPRDTGAPVADSGASPDIGEPLDSGPADAGLPEEDAGPTPDAGPEEGTCANNPTPVTQPQACARVADVVATYLARCQPELTDADRAMLAAQACTVTEGPFNDPAVAFDPDRAATCACEILDLPCDAPNIFVAAPSCATVVTGTVTEGSVAFHPHRCAPGTTWFRATEIPGVLGLDEGSGHVLFGKQPCAGTCELPLGLGDDCSDNFGQTRDCGPLMYCDRFSDKVPVCAERPVTGELCEGDRRCVGESDFFFKPTATCTRTSSVPRCIRPRVAQEPCAVDSDCDAYFDCDTDLGECVARPGAAEPCTPPVDSPAPTGSEREFLIRTAGELCRINPEIANPGFACVQTGTTSGVASCLTLPGVGEPCGIGRGLSARCAPGAFCPAIDGFNLESEVTSTCESLIAIDELCDADWRDDLLGPQCDGGRCRQVKGGPGSRYGICVPINQCVGRGPQ